jgi:DeoR family deoxyribose operon repressor
MTKKSQRLEKITAFLKNNNGASTKEIAAYAGVSEMTARRDLYELRDANAVNYISGVAIYIPRDAETERVTRGPLGGEAFDDGHYELDDEKRVNNEKKAAVGKLAAELLEPGDVIIIDTGTTTEQVAFHIPENLRITALCFNFNILRCLLNNRQSQILMAGGVYHPNTQMFESPEGVQLINRTRANKVFLSAAGVSEHLGITCVKQYEIETKKAIINAALSRILTVDSSKFGKIRPALFAQLSDIDAIITDKGISREWADIIRAAGITLHLADA